MERSLVDIATNTTPDTGAIKLDYIDSLRGIAILGVIAVHALLVVGTTEHMPPLFVALVANGAWGVRLFFIASAFTLCLSGNNRKKYERRPKLNFFLRRWFRIAPIYYLGLIGYSAWTYFSTLRIPALSNVVLEVFFLHGLTPNTINGIVPGGWSITVEMCFYCSIPLLIRYVTSLTRAMWFLLGSMLVNALFGYILYKHPFTADLHTWNLFLALAVV